MSWAIVPLFIRTECAPLLMVAPFASTSLRSGSRCSCGEENFDSEQAHHFPLVNKVLHKEYVVKLGPIRSNLILRIPAELANALKFEKGEKVLIKADDIKRFHVEAVA